MNLIRCRHPWDCTICAFATVLGLTYEQMVAKLGHDGSRIIRPGLPDPDCRQGVHVQEVLDVAEDLGYILTPFEARPCSGANGLIHEIEFHVGNAYRFNRFLEGQVGVLIGLNLRNRAHAVVWDMDHILDPADGQVKGAHLFQPQTFWRALSSAPQRLAPYLTEAN